MLSIWSVSLSLDFTHGRKSVGWAGGNLISCTTTLLPAVLLLQPSYAEAPLCFRVRLYLNANPMTKRNRFRLPRINHSPNKALLSPPLLFLGVEKQQLTCGCFHFLNSQKGLRRPTGQSHETVGFIWRLPSSSCFPLDLQNPLLSI